MRSLSPKLWKSLSLAACLAVALLFALPLLVRCIRTAHGWSCEPILPRQAETDDARQFAMMWEVSRVSLQDFGELPSWNPYHCGGVVHYLDPQVPFPGPLFFLLFFWLPAVPSIKLWNIAHFVIGALGTRKLVKDQGGNVPEQILACALVLGCGALTEHLGGGQLWFAPFLLMPWVLWAYWRSLRDPRWAVLVAALFALAMLEGGVYPVPLMFTALAFDALGRLGNAEERRGLVRSAAVFAILFPLLAGVKFVPVLRFLSAHPRLMPLDDSMSLAEVFQALTTRAHSREFAGHVYVWPEFNAYVGVVPVLLWLAAAAAVLVLRGENARRARLQLWISSALLWCALGNTSRFSPFAVLHHLPVFQSLRVPSRFLYPAVVVAALLIVSFLVALRRWTEARMPGQRAHHVFVAAELLLAVVVTTDLFLTTGPRLQQGLSMMLPEHRASADYHLTADANYSELPDFPVRAMGTTECYGGFDWPVSRALWTKGSQERLDPADAGKVVRLRWSPSSITFRVETSRPATLIVDQNFDEGWRATLGAPVSHEGLLALEVPAGDRQVTFRHRPQGLELGLAMTGLGVFLSLGLLLVPRRNSLLDRSDPRLP